MKIAFFEYIKGEEEFLKNNLPEHELIFSKEKINKDNIDIAKDADAISVFVNSEVKKDIIDILPNLKFITTRSTGYDHIDYKYAESKGIKVSNVPAYGSFTVAEFTFALILNLSRKVYDAYNNLREGSNFDITNLQGFDLHGKTIGVIGTGKIGKNVIKIAKGFGMEILAFDLYPDLSFSKEYNFEYKSLEEVVSSSDIITLHAPYTESNYHLINKEKVSMMKKGVYIINAARGELIDTEALIWGLKEGIVGGAGLDVLEGERELKDEFEIMSDEDRRSKVKDYKTLLENHLLIDKDNVVVTPHVAWYSKEALEDILKTTVLNIKGFVENKPINLI